MKSTVATSNLEYRKHFSGQSAEPGNFQQFSWSDVLAVAALFLLTMVAFGQTASGYFYADDFSFLESANLVAHGHLEALFQYFYSAFPGGPYTQFYRPLIPLTFDLYYFLWGTNAIGYHLASLLFQFLSGIFLYLLSKHLLSGTKEQCWAALIVSALFVVNPLHTEVVAWPSELGDAIGTALSLMSLWLFVRSDWNSSTVASKLGLIAFGLSLLYKEVTACLPAVLAVWTFISQDTEAAWKVRLHTCAKATAAYWIVLVAYLGARCLALGTIFGGYSGSVSMGGISSIIQRAIHNAGLWKIAYPMSEYGLSQPEMQILQVLLIIAGTLIIANSLSQQRSKKSLSLLAFSACWLILTLLPTLPVWHISSFLSGARYMHLALAPLSFFFLIAILPLCAKESNKSPVRQMVLKGIAVVLSSSFIVCYCHLSQRESNRWLAAGDEIETLQSKLGRAIKAVPKGKQFALLNVPDEIQGVPAFTSISMLGSLVRPPLSKEDLANRLSSLSVLFFPSDLVNITRLRSCLRAGNIQFHIWNSASQELECFQKQLASKPPSASADSITLLIKSCSELEIAGKQIKRLNCALPKETSTLNWDFVEIESASTRTSHCVSSKDKSSLSFSCKPASSETGIKQLQVQAEPGNNAVREKFLFPVSQYLSWTLADKDKPITVDLPADLARRSLTSVKLSSGSSLIPILLPKSAHYVYSCQSVYHLNGAPAEFLFDASKISEVDSVILEISGPDIRFVDYSRQLRDSELSAYSWRRIKLNGLRGYFKLPHQMFKAYATYELRIAGLSANGRVIGYLSDPVELESIRTQAESVTGKQP